MQLRLRFVWPGLLLALLASCGFPVHSDHTSNPAPVPSNGTNHTSTTALFKPTSNITATTQNVTLPPVTLPPVITAVPLNTTAASTNTTTPPTTSTTSSTTGKTNSTKTPPASSKSPRVTTATPKTPPVSSNSSAVTVTPRAAANLSRISGFDVASFIGGIVLTLGLLIIGYIGCRTYHSKRGVQYRTIDEHDAII